MACKRLKIIVLAGVLCAAASARGGQSRPTGTGGGWVFKTRQSQLAQPEAAKNKTQASADEPAVWAAPIAAGGESVFFTSAIDHRVVCLDAATGKKRWAFTAGGAIRRAPTYWDAKIYVGSDDGSVYCLDAETGKVVWRHPPPAERCMIGYGKIISAWPVRTDVLVEDGVAYFGSGVFPHDGAFVTALDAKTGRAIWRNGSAGESPYDWLALSPSGYLNAKDGVLFVGCDGKGVKSFLLANGQPTKAKGGSPRPGHFHPGNIELAGRKFSSKGGGIITCNAGKPGREIVEEIVNEPFGDSPQFSDAAETIVKHSGVKEGYALVLECRTGALALELARRTNLEIYAVFRDEALAAA
ncbi:MAG: outer membrane protein assembly factor BamB family protein, partial [Planctomycetota bacterium]